MEYESCVLFAAQESARCGLDIQRERGLADEARLISQANQQQCCRQTPQVGQRGIAGPDADHCQHRQKRKEDISALCEMHYTTAQITAVLRYPRAGCAPSAGPSLPPGLLRASARAGEPLP